MYELTLKTMALKNLYVEHMTKQQILNAALIERCESEIKM